MSLHKKTITLQGNVTAILNRAAERSPVNREAPEVRAVIKNQADGEHVDIDVYDDIGPSWLGMVDAKAVSKALKGHEMAKQLNIRINSAGGDVFEGIAIYNILARHSARVVVDIDGIAASIATVIAMAGDEIRIADNGMMAIHNPFTFAAGEAEDLRRLAGFLDDAKAAIVKTYAARTGMAADAISKLMDDTTEFTADEAVAQGFADSKAPLKSGKTTKPDASVHNSLAATPRLAAARVREMKSLIGS